MRHRHHHLQALSRIVAVAFVLLQMGCGYALVGLSSNLPEDIQSIFIAPLENRTTRAQVEQFLTEAITDEMLARRRYTIVRSPAEADAQLIGEITAFRVTPVTFDSEGRAEEYEISISADVSFERVGSDEVIWANENYLFREIYEIDEEESSFFDRQNLAARDAAERFAETIITEILEGF